MTFPNCCCPVTPACKCFWGLAPLACTARPTYSPDPPPCPPLSLPLLPPPLCSELVACRVEVAFPHEYYFAETFEKVSIVCACSPCSPADVDYRLPPTSPPFPSPLSCPVAPGCQEVSVSCPCRRRGDGSPGAACATRFVPES